MSRTFFIISITGYVLAALCLIIAVILFWKLRIRVVIKDLNGTLAQEEIRDLRKRSVQKHNMRMDIFEPGERTTGQFKNAVSDAKPEVQKGKAEDCYETSVLQSRKVIRDNFVITTDIVYVNTEEYITS